MNAPMSPPPGFGNHFVRAPVASRHWLNYTSRCPWLTLGERGLKCGRSDSLRTVPAYISRIMLNSSSDRCGTFFDAESVLQHIPLRVSRTSRITWRQSKSVTLAPSLTLQLGCVLSQSYPTATSTLSGTAPAAGQLPISSANDAGPARSTIRSVGDIQYELVWSAYRQA